MNNLLSEKFKKRLIFIFFFMCAFLLALGAREYKLSLDSEVIRFTMQLPNEKVQIITYDIGKEGLPKYLIQPSNLELNSGRSGLKNTSDKKLNLQVQLVNLSKTEITTSYQTQKVQLQSQQAFGVNFSFAINRSEVYQKEVAKFCLRFIDVDSNQIVGEVVFVIRNSRYE